MTRRQINMGVTEEGIRSAKAGEFLKDKEAFTAKMSMVKKGQYKDVIRFNCQVTGILLLY